METQDMNVQSEERVKVVWLIKGIAKSKITLQPAQISEAQYAPDAFYQLA